MIRLQRTVDIGGISLRMPFGHFPNHPLISIPQLRSTPLHRQGPRCGQFLIGRIDHEKELCIRSSPMQHKSILRHEITLLQQHLASRQVGKEGFPRFDPGLMTSKMGSPPAHPHTGLIGIIKGLMHPMMQEKAIGSGMKTTICTMFQEGRIFGILTDLRPTGKGLGTHNPLPCTTGSCNHLV